MDKIVASSPKRSPSKARNSNTNLAMSIKRILGFKRFNDKASKIPNMTISDFQILTPKRALEASKKLSFATNLVNFDFFSLPRVPRESGFLEKLSLSGFFKS
ncbi:hypothetical protein L596_022259 [Steinernema carpocapsae]|uniref:Uncharacterized protein n=1 Tax=Steinernema carpocapsae TaxID=34508 RepID=A0A4U5ML79_STECR|nr:hypothetical protein L596_022259 [Steinernema carpocapsae]